MSEPRNEPTADEPPLAYVREFVEDCAFLRAVVSLAQQTFTLDPLAPLPGSIASAGNVG